LQAAQVPTVSALPAQTVAQLRFLEVPLKAKDERATALRTDIPAHGTRLTLVANQDGV